MINFSKKLCVMIIAIVAILFIDNTEKCWMIVALASAYSGGQGLADFGKHKGIL